jgi:hypothetical protein
MLKIEELKQKDLVKIGEFKKPYTKKYDHNFSKIKLSIERQHQSNILIHSLKKVIHDVNICEAINDYVHVIPYRINLNHTNNNFNDTSLCLLPLIKNNSIYAVSKDKFDIMMLYENELICLLSDFQKDFLYVSHLHEKDNSKYACLGITRMYDLYHIKKAYQETYQLMKKNYKEHSIEGDFRKVLQDWFEQEVATYLFKRSLMSKEVIFDNMKYITRKTKSKESECHKNKMVKKYLIK